MPMNNPPQSSAQQAQAATRQAGHDAASRVAKAGEEIQQTTESLANTAMARVRDAREQAESTLEDQREMIATRVRRLGSSLRAVGEMASEDQLAAQLLDGASHRVDRVAEYIANATPGRLVGDLQRVAKTHPGWFFGSAFVLGLAAGRFLKSSSAAMQGASYEREDSHDDDEEYDRAVRRAQLAPRATYPEETSTQSATRSAHREPAYDAQQASGTQQSGASTAGGTSGTSGTSQSGSSGSGGGVSTSTTKQVSTAPGASFPSSPDAATSTPKPQPTSVSSTPRQTEPGQGTKS